MPFMKPKKIKAIFNSGPQNNLTEPLYLYYRIGSPYHPSVNLKLTDRFGMKRNRVYSSQLTLYLPPLIIHPSL